MKRKIVLKVLLGIVVLAVVIIFLTPVIIEPWVGRKIQAALNEKYKDYIVEIDKVHISMIPSLIELKNITITSKLEHEGIRDLNGGIKSIKFKGVKLTKALFKREFDINEILISNYTVKGKVPFPKKAKPPKVSHSNIRIGKVLFDKINLAIEDTSGAMAFSVKEGFLKVYNLKVGKQDTLTPGIIQQFDFEAEELLSVSADSMYTYKANGITYHDTLKTLSLKGLTIQPNYSNYDFTARHKFETDRIEALFSNIYLYNFPAEAYLKSGNLVSSYIEIGKMEINVFRDKRQADSHVKKPAFQELIYNFQGVLGIDSIGLKSGNVTYTEHAEKANEPGSISINKMNARIYNIANDTIFKTENASLELMAEGLIMGKCKMSVVLKSKLFDPQNTFSVKGTVSNLEIKELNPWLEKNAFVYATSGKIEKMDFNFTANNAKASGKMIMLYHGFKLTVKNKRTDDTTSIKERFLSIIANEKAVDSNPVPGEKVRVGMIDYERDPEKFFFNYCFNAILSGIKSSIINNTKEKKEKKEKKTFIQKIFGKPEDKQEKDMKR
jgi:hypothetical protein